MKRSFSFLLSFFLLITGLSAWTGGMFGQKDLRVSKTKWFDIIYPAECAQTAAIIYEQGDNLYDKACSQYGVRPSFRMPVVITPAVEKYNAFWTSAPYNHIVIYDTGVSGDSEIAVFSEVLAGTFYHELTHAVTYNMKNNFWTEVGKFFGDPIVPGSLLIPSGMAEGATVASESLKGEGRLNNEYTKQYVTQAKLEDKFPSYYDYFGGSSVVPYGGYYYFNGAFAQWVQKKYGLKAYANFWYNLVNFQSFTVAGSYKKAFGAKLSADWKLFADELKIPDAVLNPIEAETVKDFFKPEKDDYSLKNNSGAMYTSLTASENSLAWIENLSSKVLYLPKEKLNDKNVKPETLFTLAGVSKISLSRNGRFLTVCYFDNKYPADKSKLKIYDIQKKRFFQVKGHGFLEGTVVQKDSKYFLIASKYESPKNQIYISEIILKDDGKVKGMAEPLIVNQDENVIPFSFTSVQNGAFAYIQKEKMKYSIVVSDTDGNSFTQYSFDKPDLVLNSISYDDDKLYFSWASSGTMPRAGFLDLQTGSTVFGFQDISGGVHSPVMAQNQMVFIGKFYRQNRLLRQSSEVQGETSKAEVFEYKNVIVIPEGNYSISENCYLKNERPDTVMEYTPYNPFNYLKRGIFIPLGIYTTENFGSNTDYSSGLDTAFIGATYITSNPWTDGNSDLYILTGGWNYFSNSAGFELKANMGTANSLLQSVWDVKAEFDGKGFKQIYGNATLSSSFYLGNITYLSAGVNVQGGYGRQNRQINSKDLGKDENYRNLGIISAVNADFESAYQNTVSFGLGNIHRAGSSSYSKAGVFVGINAGYRFDTISTIMGLRKFDTTIVSPNIKICIPQLIPFDCVYGLTYNLPVTLSGALFPASSNYGFSVKHTFAGKSVFEGTAESILFAFDVEKGVPLVNFLYVNDLFVSAGYSCTLATGQLYKSGVQIKNLEYYMEKFGEGKGTFLDGVFLKAGINFRPNFGITASSSYAMKFYGKATYAIRKTEETKSRLNFSLGFETAF